MPGALADIRVLDFTHALNGPFCTMLLGHLGAEIVKIEPPNGDAFRRSWMPPGSPSDGYEFMFVNTNKKSVAIDLKTSAGQELARKLIAVSDVLVENYYKDTMASFGLDYERVREINPRLIYACTRGYGETGPYSGYGSNAGHNNGMAGWTHTAWEMNGAWGTKPLGIGDEAAGINMALGIVAALHARERTGEGQKIEVSMQEAVMSFMVSNYHERFTGNKVGGVPRKVADGYFNLRAPEISDAQWQRLAAAIGLDVGDARFATRDARRAHQRELDAALYDWAKDRTRDEVWVTLRDLGYFGAPVLSIEEVMADPHVKARDAWVDYDHPTGGPIKLLAPWIHMAGTPAAIRSLSPAVGQHTDEVLSAMLGLGADEIEGLRAKNVVR